MRFTHSIKTPKRTFISPPRFLRRAAAFGLLGALSLGMLAPSMTRAAVGGTLESAGLISIPAVAVDQTGPTTPNSPATPAAPATPARAAARAPAAAPSIVGLWSNQVNNILFATSFNADGTMTSIWADATTGKILYEGNGTYTFDGKHLTYSFPPASQEADIVFTDANHIDYRTTKSTIAGAVGIETIMTRAKEVQSGN